MRFNKKISMIVLILLTSNILSGCVYDNEAYKEVEEKSKKIAKEYVMEKYNEEFNVDDIFMDASPGHIFNESPGGKVILTDKEKGYSVYVNVYSSEEKLSVGDDRYSNSISEDIKKEYLDKFLKDMEYTIVEYKVYEINHDVSFSGSVHGEFFAKDTHYDDDLEKLLKERDIGIFLEIFFKAEEVDEDEITSYVDNYKDMLDDMLDKITSDFSGVSSTISLHVYKPDKYMNDEVKAILDKRPAYSSSDNYIYSSNYVYLNILASKSYTYNVVDDEYEKVILPWEISYSRGNDTEIIEEIKDN